MIKAKIMLLSVIIAASAGGILAFQSRTLGMSKYCFLVTNEEPSVGMCTLTIQNRSARPVFGAEDVVYYTTTEDLTKCVFAICTITGIPDQQ